MVPLIGEFTMQGKLFTLDKPSTAVGGVSYLTSQGLLMMEGLNAAAAKAIAD